jgi:uncharacterized membrane protein
MEINQPFMKQIIPKQKAPVLATAWMSSEKTVWVALAVIMMLTTALRFYNADSPLMWFDELATLGMGTAQYSGGNEKCFPRDVVQMHPRNTSSIASAEPLLAVWEMQAKEDVHPPGYYNVFYFWRKMFGDSFASVRMPSILPSIASVFLIFLIGRQLYDSRTGLWAALLMCLASPQIIYANHVRPYCFLTFLGLCTALAVLQIEKHTPTAWRALLLGVLSFYLAFTHYFSIGLLVALSIYCIIRLRGNKLVCAMSGFAIGGALFLTIWGTSMHHQFFGNQWQASYYATRQNPEVAKHALEFLAAWPERIFLHLPIEIITRPPMLIILLLSPGFAIIWKRNLLLPWLWVICTAGFVWGMDVFRNTFHFIEIRYTLLAAPGVYFLVAAGIFIGRRQAIWNSILPAILAIFLISQIPKAYTRYKENWFEMAELINKSGSPMDAIILPLAGEPWQSYWPKFIWTGISYYIYNPNRPMALISKPLNSEMMAQIGWGRGAWVLTRIPDFPQSASKDWPTTWVPGCRVDGSWAAQDRATIYHVILPDAPISLFPVGGN